MLIEAEFACAYCGEINATTADASAGKTQDYVEDCQVCCRPNLLHLEIDLETEVAVRVQAEQESDQF